jgi:capsular polysaccharide biosynthesis protein
MNPQNDEIEIDLRELVHVILKRIWIILAATVAGGVIIWLVSYYLIVPKYQSTSQIYILTNSEMISLTDLQMGSSLANDYQIMIKGRPVINAVIDKLDLNMSYGQVLGMLSINNPTNSRILEITIEYTDPQVAMEIANAFAEVSSETISETMKVEEPSFYSEAVVASGQSSPNNRRNALLGALVGLVLSVGIVIVLHIIDDTIKNSEDVERFLGINTLAAIPEEGGTDNNEKNSGKQQRGLLRIGRK